MTPDAARALLYGAKVTLTDRPSSLAAPLRPIWRVPVTALLVDASRAKRAKREQLIVLNWAVRSEQCAAALAAFLQNETSSESVGVRYEPALVRAVNIAVGAGLFSVDGDWLCVSDAGRALVAEIGKRDLYQHERRMLALLPKPLSLNAAVQLLRGGV